LNIADIVAYASSGKYGMLEVEFIATFHYCWNFDIINKLIYRVARYGNLFTFL
jgi:hypothetical protein